MIYNFIKKNLKLICIILKLNKLLMPSIGYYSGSSSFYLDESGLGSYIELDLNVKKNISLEEDNHSKGFAFVIIPLFMPFILGLLFGIILVYLKIKYFIEDTCRDKKNYSKKNTKVNHKGLTSNFIKELNNKNFRLANDTLECSICIDSLNLKRKKNVIFLNCGHAFHKKCLQEWVKTNINQGTCISCPMCREHIITNSYPKIVYSSDTDTYSLTDEF